MLEVFNLRLVIAVAALAMAVAFVPSARAGETITVIKGVYVCLSYNAKQQQQYVSDVFTVNAGGQGLSTAWSRFLLTKYHVQDRVTCRRGGGQETSGKNGSGEDRTWVRLGAHDRALLVHAEREGGGVAGAE